MTEKAEAVERAVDLAEKFASKIEALAVKHSPEVWDLALTAARIDAATNIVYGFFGLSSCVGFIFATRYFYKCVEEKADEGTVLGMVFSCAATVATGLVVIAHWADLWVWAGVIEPKLWLAKQALGF